MRHVVLGAGPLGVSLARQLAASGVEASLHSVMGNPAYDMPGTRPDSVDGTDAAVLRDMMRGADVAYLLLNAHYVDWYDLFPPRLEAAISASEATGTRLIYHDDLYMYGPNPQTLTESTPNSSRTRKGRLRADMARTFLDAVATGRVIGAIGRSADMYGPGALNSSFNSTLGQRHFYPLLDGGPVAVLGDVDEPHTYSFVPDVAKGLMTLAMSSGTDGEVWHLPAAPTLSHRGLLTIAFELVGRSPRIRSSSLSALFLRMIGVFQKDVREVAEMLYQYERPLRMSHQKFEERFGVEVTPHRDALQVTLDWYRANPIEKG